MLLRVQSQWIGRGRQRRSLILIRPETRPEAPRPERKWNREQILPIRLFRLGYLRSDPDPGPVQGQARNQGRSRHPGGQVEHGDRRRQGGFARKAAAVHRRRGTRSDGRSSRRRAHSRLMACDPRAWVPSQARPTSTSISWRSPESVESDERLEDGPASSTRHLPRSRRLAGRAGLSGARSGI